MKVNGEWRWIGSTVATTPLPPDQQQRLQDAEMVALREADQKAQKDKEAAGATSQAAAPAGTGGSTVLTTRPAGADPGGPHAMSSINTPNGPPVIRITKEEANDPHVEDLLKRQASLRGEGGIGRSRKGKWFYQNWFVFLIAGTMAAVGAWALLEPYFDDSLYIRPIQEVNTYQEMPSTIARGDKEYRLLATGRGWVMVNGQKVWIPFTARVLFSDGSKGPLDPFSLSPGQVIGVYVPHQILQETDLPMASFIVKNPPADAPRKASMTLAALSAQSSAAGMLLFAVVAAAIGLALGAADGIVCRVPRRALIGGAVGLLVGFIGGFVSSILANLVYTPLADLAMKQTGGSAAGLTTFGFLTQMGGRGLAWCLAGMAMGLGRGSHCAPGDCCCTAFWAGSSAACWAACCSTRSTSCCWAPTSPAPTGAAWSGLPHWRQRGRDDRRGGAAGPGRLAADGGRAAGGQGVPHLQGPHAPGLLAAVGNLPVQRHPA